MKNKQLLLVFFFTSASFLTIAVPSNAQPPGGENTYRKSSLQTAFSQPKILDTPIEDFQVNENVGSCSQWNRGIGVDNKGNFVIIWEDERNGKMQIFARCFDQNGQPLGASFLVTDSGYEPDIAMSEDGNFVITWMRPGRRWNPDVYAQSYDFNGMALGDSFKVNDDIMNKWPWGYYQQNPTVAIDSSGKFVITWQDWRNSGTGDIYAQRYEASGQPLGINFQINDDTVDNAQYWPDVTMNINGNFVITWWDTRNGDDDIYAQRYGSDGNTVGANFRINDGIGNRLQYKRVIDLDSQGDFVITWQDSRNGDYDIYAQRYKADGQRLGENFKVNDDVGSSVQYTPTIAIDKNGHFMITWYDERNGDSDIYVQRYDSTGQALGENLRVNDDSGSSSQQLPAIAANGGNFVVAWNDARNCVWDIYAQRYDSGGLAMGANFKPNDENGTSHQIEPAIAVNGNGNFVIVWNDLRYDQGGDVYEKGDDIYYKGGDVFAQRYKASGQTLEANFMINDDTGCFTQNDPVITIDKQGRITMAWEDQRNGNSDIYCRRYTSNGTPQGASFKVNDDAGTGDQFYPAIVTDGHGNFAVVWWDYRNDNPDIYGQRYWSNGTKRVTNFRINDDVENRDQIFPAIAMHSNGDFVVVWQDYRNDNPDIYGQRFTSSGSKQGTNFMVKHDVADSAQFIPAIDVEASGAFVVVWQDQRNGNADIYSQRYDSSGTPQGSNLKVNDDVGASDQKVPAISVDDDYFVVVWQDYRNGNSDIYYQLFDNDGNAVGVNYRVINDTGVSYQGNADVELVNRSIYFTWEDTRIPGHGYDIFARVDMLDYPPDSPTLVSPTNNSTFTDSIPTLTFTVPEDAEGEILHFKVEVALDSSFANQISGSPFESQNNTTGFTPSPPLTTGSGSCSYTLQSPLNDGTYYWRVSALDRFGYGETSTTYSFSVGTAPKPHINLSVASLDFGDVLINTSENLVFTIINIGNDTLIISDITCIESAFSVSDTSGIIPVNTSLEVTITFYPKEIISYMDTLKVYSNDPVEPMVKVILNGRGIKPETISVLPNPFTPNNDGYNDYVEFKYPEMRTQKPVIQIFNLRGRKVGELNNFAGFDYRWYGKDNDGRDLEPGVYIYILEIEGKKISNGTITLIR